MRIPRPYGTTYLSYKYNQTKDKQMLINHVISHYLNHNMTICMKPISITNLAISLKIPEEEIYKAISDKMSQLQFIIDPDNIQETFRVLLTASTKNALGNNALVQQQIALLLQSQGGTYKPFISGEVNQAIKTSIMANSQYLEILKTLSGPTQVNILNNHNHNQEDDALDIMKALKMIKESMPDSNKALEDVYIDNELSDAPEVNAKLQTGIDTSKEGLNIKDLTKVEKIDHGNRRAIEEGIDIEEHID